MTETKLPTQKTDSQLSRRRFFGYAGALAGAGLLVSLDACKKSDDSGTGAISLGSGDAGILNYAYALEQLEAAFYIRVAANPYTGITGTEQSYLNDVRDHEIAHREFFRKALGANAIKDLTPNFSGIDFTSRTSVLAAAKAFEDLGVSAYNGAGKLLTDPANLTMAGKIVSVEARHAAIIRDLIAINTFADTSILDPGTRRDAAKEPAEVLATASMYIVETLDASKLPMA